MCQPGRQPTIGRNEKLDHEKCYDQATPQHMSFLDFTENQRELRIDSNQIITCSNITDITWLGGDSDTC